MCILLETCVVNTNIATCLEASRILADPMSNTTLHIPDSGNTLIFTTEQSHYSPHFKFESGT